MISTYIEKAISFNAFQIDFRTTSDHTKAEILNIDTKKIKEKLGNYFVQDKDIADQVIDLLMITKYLEKIGDHTVNIARWVIYSITGE